MATGRSHREDVTGWIARRENRGHFFDAAQAPATIVALATGTIILAIRGVSELWCSPLGYGPKVLIGPSGSCLLPGRDFAHKISDGFNGI